MDLIEVLEVLNYSRSPNFLMAEQLAADSDAGHIYRKAYQKCGLHGVYALRGSVFGAGQADVPLVYVCKVDNENDGRRVHQRIWNQNIVPFILVVSPRSLCLYSGFRYRASRSEPPSSPENGILRVLTEFSEVAASLAAFRAESIDTGMLWKEWGGSVTPETRVDWKLLESLRKLDDWLVESGVDDRNVSHALIGKFVYLRYLRDRDILSDRKLEEWRIEPREVLGRNASLDSFCVLLERLDEWLNGSVFPISESGIRRLGVQRLRQVAAVFEGDTTYGQLHLDFSPYDFSFIPIETLSVIYEQFLHASIHRSGQPEGKVRGAYYTPLPVVNFMLDRLENYRPFRAGMRVLDPACGSGVFLVQCYRKLVEQRVRNNGAAPPKPTELRELLTGHVFGIDSDSDACEIAELSLILTLLDYVRPPDLSNTTFKLPALRGRNIFHGSSFDDSAEWARFLFRTQFDWVVGNPPWLELNQRTLDAKDRSVYQWMLDHGQDQSTSGNQVAEAFAWRAAQLVAPDGVVGLLVPAMTFFKYESKPFRKAFFAKTNVRLVANFANLAEVLFAGRSRVPAAALFFSSQPDVRETHPETVEVYSPLVANQVLHDPQRPGRRLDIWSIVINASEMRELPYRDVISGEALPWKLATWGSSFDKRLLTSVSRRFRSIGDLESDGVLRISEGLQLRTRHDRRSGEQLEHHSELAGKPILDMSVLRMHKYLFRIPRQAIVRVSADSVYVRKGRFRVPFAVCQPPHVLVAASRNFAIYHDAFLIVPPRQIGIGSEESNASFLRALALYLNSDFAIYHQFLMSPQLGVQRLRATLQALRSLPVPFEYDSPSSLASWEDLYEKSQNLPLPELRLFEGSDQQFGRGLSPLLKSLNDLANNALLLDSRQQAVIYDLVHIGLSLNDGKIGEAATRIPSRNEIEEYARALRSELDGFLADDVAARHRIRISHSEQSGMVTVETLQDASRTQPVDVWAASTDEARQFEKARKALLEQRSQWVYFDRNLRIYEDAKVYMFKPMRRMHWTQSQAIVDASEIIAETIQSGDADLEAVNVN